MLIRAIRGIPANYNHKVTGSKGNNNITQYLDWRFAREVTDRLMRQKQELENA